MTGVSGVEQEAPHLVAAENDHQKASECDSTERRDRVLSGGHAVLTRRSVVSRTIFSRATIDCPEGCRIWVELHDLRASRRLIELARMPLKARRLP
jgi:hypothetical protein